jgi:flagellar capping protein FliD
MTTKTNEELEKLVFELTQREKIIKNQWDIISQYLTDLEKDLKSLKSKIKEMRKIK